jgi:hypothetical protein
MPAMMFVAWPVVDACATCLTGLVVGARVVLGDVHQRAVSTRPDDRTRRTAAIVVICRWRPTPPIIQSVTK